MIKSKLLKLVRAVESRNDFDEALLISNDLILQGIEIPQKLEEALLEFIAQKGKDSFTSLSKEIVMNNYLGSHIENIALLVFLYRREWLAADDTMRLLILVPHDARKDLAPRYLKLLEVADLVYEDLRDGFMTANDDNLLENAIIDVCLESD